MGPLSPQDLVDLRGRFAESEAVAAAERAAATATAVQVRTDMKVLAKEVKSLRKQLAAATAAAAAAAAVAAAAASETTKVTNGSNAAELLPSVDEKQTSAAGNTHSPASASLHPVDKTDQPIISE